MALNEITEQKLGKQTSWQEAKHTKLHSDLPQSLKKKFEMTPIFQQGGGGLVFWVCCTPPQTFHCNDLCARHWDDWLGALFVWLVQRWAVTKEKLTGTDPENHTQRYTVAIRVNLRWNGKRCYHQPTPPFFFFFFFFFTVSANLNHHWIAIDNWLIVLRRLQAFWSICDVLSYHC